MHAQLGMPGVVGYLPWEWDSRNPGVPYTDGKTDWRYGPGDPSLVLMDGYLP